MKNMNKRHSKTGDCEPKTKPIQLSVAEKEIQSAIEDLLKIMEKRGVLAYQKNNSGALRTERYTKGGSKKTSYIRFGKKGASDFLVYIKGGLTLHVEVKSLTGYQSADQVAFMNKMNALGHPYHIVRSVDEFRRVLSVYLC